MEAAVRGTRSTDESKPEFIDRGNGKHRMRDALLVPQWHQKGLCGGRARLTKKWSETKEHTNGKQVEARLCLGCDHAAFVVLVEETQDTVAEVRVSIIVTIVLLTKNTTIALVLMCFPPIIVWSVRMMIRIQERSLLLGMQMRTQC
mmetsp:Transcript_17198/g.35325  ORF Transcript_17198/g.35325 Transcript_17198/m.35325 type:complete len:146 (-) Transcript_17198:1070-1507(-)